MDFDFIQFVVLIFVKGLWLIVVLMFVVVVVGFNFGFVFVVMWFLKNWFVSGFVKGYSIVFWGMLLFVQFFFFYYGFGQIVFVWDNFVFWWIIGDGVYCVVMVLVFNIVVYMLEILCGGFLLIFGGFVEVVQVCGML